LVDGFIKNVNRKDPYKNFKFRIILDGKPVLGISKVGAIKRTTEVVKHRDGNDPSHDSKSPGRTTYDPITLEREVGKCYTLFRWGSHDGPCRVQKGINP
jgi:phage tail-like protein